MDGVGVLRDPVPEGFAAAPLAGAAFFCGGDAGVSKSFTENAGSSSGCGGAGSDSARNDEGGGDRASWVIDFGGHSLRSLASSLAESPVI